MKIVRPSTALINFPSLIKDVKKSDEAFITSATQYVMPVIRVDNYRIGNGRIGRYAEIFRKVYMEALKLSQKKILQDV